MAALRTKTKRGLETGGWAAGGRYGCMAMGCGMLRVQLSSSAVILWIILASLLSGCGPKPQQVYEVGPHKQISKTPVALIYHTPEPTIAVMLAPTPSLTPTLDHDPDYYYGSLTVTLDHAGQTIYLKKGQYFLLNLGQTYAWAVTLEPENIISLNRKLTPEPGEQGVYIARQPGKTKLRAIGQPVCRSAQPACSRPDLLFQMTVVVQ